MIFILCANNLSLCVVSPYNVSVCLCAVMWATCYAPFWPCILLCTFKLSALFGINCVKAAGVGRKITCEPSTTPEGVVIVSEEPPVGTV